MDMVSKMMFKIYTSSNIERKRYYKDHYKRQDEEKSNYVVVGLQRKRLFKSYQYIVVHDQSHKPALRHKRKGTVKAQLSICNHC